MASIAHSSAAPHHRHQNSLVPSTSKKRKHPSSGPSQYHDQTSSTSRTTLNPLKKRRRDLTRLLSHTSDPSATSFHANHASQASSSSRDLPATIRQNYERELQAVDAEIEAAREAAARKALVGRYHMVRFFERKKAMRMLKRAKKRMRDMKVEEETRGGDDNTTIDELEAEVKRCEVDLQYTLNYPLDMAYYSLYGKKDGGISNPTTTNTTSDKDAEKAAPEAEGEADEDTISADRTHPVWKTVEEALALALSTGTGTAAPTASNPSTTGKQASDARLQLLRAGKIPIDLTSHPHLAASATTAAKPNTKPKSKTKPKPIPKLTSTNPQNPQRAPNTPHHNPTTTTNHPPRHEHKTSDRPTYTSTSTSTADAKAKAKAKAKAHLSTAPPMRDTRRRREAVAEWEAAFADMGGGRAGAGRDGAGRGSGRGAAGGRKREEAEEEDDGTGVGFFEFGK